MPTATWTVLGASTMVAAAVLTWPGRGLRARYRVRALWPPAEPPDTNRSGPGGRRVRFLAVLAAGAATAWFVGLPWGPLVGTAAATLAYVGLDRFEPASERRRKERLATDLPIAVDLMAACLRSGTTPTSAAEAVARGIGGPVGEALDEVVALLRLGGDPVECWTSLARDPVLAPLGRAVGRAISSGAPVVAALEQVALDAREQRRSTAEEAARKVGVKAAAPLGICFLPAFVLLGVVPVVAGIASNVDLW